MRTERINSIEDARVQGYRGARDGDLARDRGTFLVEGRLVVEALLEHSGYRARSVLGSESALGSIEGAVARAEARWGEEVAVYVADRGVMDGLVGFPIHRGCIAECDRGPVRSAEEVVGALEGDAAIVVLEGVNNHDNVGGIFRSALSLGARAVLIDPGTVDPLYRKSIRVSIGAALRLPWGATGALPEGLECLKRAGFVCVGLTPDGVARDLDAFAREAPGRVAIVVGAEGPGLTAATASACDARVRIAMAPEVDSLNVGTAAAIALHRLVRRVG